MQVNRLLDEKAKESETDATGRDTYCEHIPHGEPHFAHGMCRNCFVEYLNVSGGTFDGQHDPPAYQTVRGVPHTGGSWLHLAVSGRILRAVWLWLIACTTRQQRCWCSAWAPS